MRPLHPHWRESFARAAKEATVVYPETICPMKDIRLPYRERLCKIPAACVIASGTSCRIRPADEVKS